MKGKVMNVVLFLMR
jgi:hypothetical protein